MNTTAQKEFFTVPEAAEFLRRSVRTIRSAVAENRITYSKTDGVLTFRKSDLLEYWLRGRVNARVPQILLPADSPLLDELRRIFRPWIAAELQNIQEVAMAEHNGERAFV